MIVLRTYIKRLLARPWTIVLTIAVPAFMVVVAGMGGGSDALRVAVIDLDESYLSELLVEAIEPVSILVELDQEELSGALIEGRLEYAMIIPRGMQESVVAGDPARIETYSLQGVQVTWSIRSAVDALLSAAHNVAAVTRGDAQEFVATMQRVRDGRYRVVTDTYRADHGALPATAAAGVSQLIGMLTLTMLLLTMATCLMFLGDVETGVFHRSLAGPVSLRRYMLETNGAFYCATVLQAVTATAAVRLLFPQLAPVAIAYLALILAVFALVAVSFALAIANLAGTARRTAIVTNLLIMPMAMLGGAFWPADIMPDFLQRIASFTPTRWTTAATQAALSGGGAPEVLPQVGILFLFALVFQLLGSWKPVDVSK